MKSTYLWKAKTLEGAHRIGVEQGKTKSEIYRHLTNQGFFSVALSPIPRKIMVRELSNKELLSFIKAFRLSLSSGLSLIETLSLLLEGNPDETQQYITHRILSSLRKGHSLKHSFESLGSVFPRVFLEMIGVCEKSGQLLNGLEQLELFYQKKEKRASELKKITQYPKTVLTITLLISLGIIVFIIPMFKNIYSLFKDELPVMTKMLVTASDALHYNKQGVVVTIIIFICFLKIPLLRRFNPVLRLFDLVKVRFQSRDDPFIFAFAMKMLIGSGQILGEAVQTSAACMTGINRKYGFRIKQYLEEGYTTFEAFQKVSWFPKVIEKIIYSAEKSGGLAQGFEQAVDYLEQQRDDEFQRWQRLVEPVMMVGMGAYILFILLSVYLPIFDVGNKVGI